MTEAPPIFEATVGRFWPGYELRLAVIDRTAGTVDSERATDVPPTSIGEAMMYSAETYGLEINATATPIVEDGHVYSPSVLSRFGIKVRELKCEYVGN